VVVVEAVAGRDVEPRVLGHLQRGQPGSTGLTPLGKRLQHLGRVAAVDEQVVHALLHRQHGQPLQFVVRAVHGDLDPGNHAAQGLVRDLREGLLAELEEDDVGPVAEHQELGVVVPHRRVQVQAAVELLAHVVVLRDPPPGGDVLHRLQFRQFRDLDRLDRLDQRGDPLLPADVERIPVLVVVPGPLLELGQPGLDLLGVQDGIRGDVHPAVQHPVLDPQRGGKGEHPRGVRADGRVGNLGGDDVESRHRLGEVHRVVEPEPLVVLGLEAGVPGVHARPVLGSRYRLDLRGQEEACGGLGDRLIGHVHSSLSSGAARPRLR
jgi:hypothetical protein